MNVSRTRTDVVATSAARTAHCTCISKHDEQNKHTHTWKLAVGVIVSLPAGNVSGACCELGRVLR